MIPPFVEEDSRFSVKFNANDYIVGRASGYE